MASLNHPASFVPVAGGLVASLLAACFLAACVPDPATSKTASGGSGGASMGSGASSVNGGGGAGGGSGTAGNGGSSAWPSNVTEVTSKSGDSVTVPGDLADGGPMSDLKWASLSPMACFTPLGNESFNGNHVLYATQLPSDADIAITVTPDDAGSDVSLYAYSNAINDFEVPPAITSCLSCEASYDFEDNENPGESQTVTLHAFQDPFNVFIGVAGAQGATAGSYQLVITVTPH